MGLKSGQTIGYHYLGSVLFGIGRGPVNCLTHVKVADEIVWDGASNGNSVHAIDRPDAFGGEKQEGGIQGLFRNFMGRYDQVLPGASPETYVGSKGPYKRGVLPSVKDLLGGRVGEFRGRHMLWYDGLLSSMNPYIKEWSFRRWRTTAGWHNDTPWYPAKATIFLKGGDIRAMNPAHIVYQCITDPSWGGKRATAELNEDSFVLCANTFCEEQFGLCFHWQRSDEVGKFIQTVIDHAAAVVYTDRETGLINMKLIRGDYDPDDLPHFTLDSGLLSISEDDSGSSDAIVDEVIVNGKDPISDQVIEGRAHNLAVRRFRQGATTTKLEYPGLPTIELCNRVAERDRDAAAAGLRKFTVKLDRAGFKIHPGAVFRVSHTAKGLSGIVLRAGEVDDGNMVGGEITIKCVQDVFSLPLTSFVTPVENTWTNGRTPLPAEAEMIEASYRDIYLRAGTSDLEAIVEGDAAVGVAASRPSSQNINYDLTTRAEGEPSFSEGMLSSFTANALTTAALDATDTTVTLSVVADWDEDLVVGMMGYIDGEYVQLAAWDTNTATATLVRGCVDTWPRPHVSGARLWLVDDDLGSDGREYSAGETVEAKVLSKTSNKTLAPELAPIISIELVGRPFKPYPPADVKVDGVSIFSTAPGATVEPGVSWVERNRKTQGDTAVGFTDPTVSAEAGTTYEIDILTQDGATVINTYAGITSPWTYASADQVTDGTDAFDTIPAKLYAVRDGVRSLEQDWFLIRGDRCGYGFNYGNNYGGDCA